MTLTSDRFDSIWGDLYPALKETAVDVVAETSMQFQIGRLSNEQFPFRAYLVFTKSQEGNEFVISIDVVKSNDGLELTSDVCEEASILGTGPERFLEQNRLDQLDEILNEWLVEFRTFLASSKTLIVKASSRRAQV